MNRHITGGYPHLIIVKFIIYYQSLNCLNTSYQNKYNFFLHPTKSSIPTKVLIFHDVLAVRLYQIPIHDQVHAWFMSYISNRRSSIRIHNRPSSPFSLLRGVPQGSVLEPPLFIIDIIILEHILSRYPSINYHIYADDLQIYTSLSTLKYIRSLLLKYIHVFTLHLKFNFKTPPYIKISI